MLRWLKKFVLDSLPSIAATIIGAYIVHHYIIPKSQSADPQPSIASVLLDVFGSKSADAAADKSAVEKVSYERDSFEKGVAEKAAIEKSAEKAASDRSALSDKTASIDKSTIGATDAAAETRKHHPVPKIALKPAAALPPPVAADERKASDLARAALERLRGGNSEPGRDTVARQIANSDATKTQDVPRMQPVSTIAAVPPMQPLPPAISVSSPSADVFEQGSAAPVVRQPFPQSVARSSDSARFAPPADIPASRPLDIRAEASIASSSARTSVTDDVMSAARSMFHAVIPQ